MRDSANKKERMRLTVAMSRIISLFTTFTEASVNFESHWPARTDLLTGSLNFSLSTRTPLVVHCHPRGYSKKERERGGEGELVS